MNDQEWREVVRFCDGNWTPMSEAMQEVWLDELSDRSVGAVLSALRRLRADRPSFAPRLGELLAELNRPGPRELPPPQPPIGDRDVQNESRPWTTHRAMVRELNARRAARGNRAEWINTDPQGRRHSGWYTLPSWPETDCAGVLRWWEAGHPSMVLVECERCGEEVSVPRGVVTEPQPRAAAVERSP